MLLTFVPLMAIMFALLALLEDSGYMARAAVVTDRLMPGVGLPGRAFLPLVVGFGCNVPAISAAPFCGARQRMLTALLVPFTLCTARLTVFVLMSSIFFPASRRHGGVRPLRGVHPSHGLAGLRCAPPCRAMGTEPLVIDLPPYQRPTLRLLPRPHGCGCAASWDRVGIIVATVGAVWVLASSPPPERRGASARSRSRTACTRAAEQASACSSRQVSPSGTPRRAHGRIRRQGGGHLSWAQTYPADGDVSTGVYRDFVASSGGHPQAAAAAFLVFLLAYTPCVATLAAQKRQIGVRWTPFGVVMRLAVAWLLAVAIFQIGSALA